MHDSPSQPSRLFPRFALSPLRPPTSPGMIASASTTRCRFLSPAPPPPPPPSFPRPSARLAVVTALRSEPISRLTAAGASFPVLKSALRSAGSSAATAALGSSGSGGRLPGCQPCWPASCSSGNARRPTTSVHGMNCCRCQQNAASAHLPIKQPSFEVLIDCRLVPAGPRLLAQLRKGCRDTHDGSLPPELLLCRNHRRQLVTDLGGEELPARVDGLPEAVRVP